MAVRVTDVPLDAAAFESVSAVAVVVLASVKVAVRVAAEAAYMQKPITDELHEIEMAIADGTYHKGPWRRVLNELRSRRRSERRAVSDEVDRISDALHRRTQRFVFPLAPSLILQVGVLGVGGILLRFSVTAHSTVAGWIALALWTQAFQPLIKIATGAVLGVKYSYAYLWGVEPRFKMRYGTYLAASRAARVIVHLSGCVGSPLGAYLVALISAPHLPLVAFTARGVMWLTAATNVLTFLGRLVGREKIMGVPLRLSSGGSAADELLGG